VAFQGRALICLVTDRRRLAVGSRDDGTTRSRLVELVGAAARAGVDLIQVREPDLDARSLCELVARCVAATTGTDARVVVNDRIDVALAAGAAGVQLRGDAPPADRVRAMTPPGFLIGRSVHSAAEGASLAGHGGLDYVVLGTVFPSPSKDPGHPVVGIAELKRIVRLVTIPVLAIGGMTLERAEEVARAGGAGIAAISLLAVEPDAGSDRRLETVVASLRRAFDTVRAVT
jgi:thiamine-phosphate pyrophosphorylase